MSNLKILAVEDDPIYAASLELVVEQLGYELTGIVDNAAAALKLLEADPPDLILMDIGIRDTMNGIELAARINQTHRVPLIYVTAFKDNAIFQQAKLTSPAAYILKPYDPVSLQSAIELALFSRIDQPKPAPETTAALRDAFFIKDNTRLIKIKLDEVMMVEVDEKYCFIVTARKRHVINMRLKDLLEKLPADEFIQVHRSFVVRKSAIDEINTGDQTLRILEKTIPVGKTYKDHLLATLNYLS